jgi:hypothetical protein
MNAVEIEEAVTELANQPFDRAEFRIITKNAANTLALDWLTNQTLGSFARLERNVILKRTPHCINNARRAIIQMGRKPKLKPSHKLRLWKWSGKDAAPLPMQRVCLVSLGQWRR